MLLTGQRWREEIPKAIRASDFAAVLFSSRSVDRDGFYQREIRACLDVLRDKASGKVWLLPIRLDECELPDEISEYQYSDLFPEWDDGLGKLLKSINAQASVKNAVDEARSVVNKAVGEAKKSVVKADSGRYRIGLLNSDSGSDIDDFVKPPSHMNF